MNSKQRSHSSGLTFVELMIGMTLLTVVSLGFAGVFSNIGKALQFSRGRTLAANLAQEQIQYIKQQTFYRVLVTTAPSFDPNFGTNVPYDSGYYPPETILEGGMYFTRYTYIEVARENSGVLNYYGAVADTGMKAVLVSVVWRQGSDYKKYQLRSILSNIDTTMSNSILNGTVSRYGTGAIISGADVTVAENLGFEDTTNGSGQYSMNVYSGNYTLMATADGYFPQYKNVSVGANATQTTDFQLIAMGSGTVRGSAWYNDHLVISQVVASTFNAAGFNQEYVELFNPTTSTWSIGDGFGGAAIRLLYQRYSDPGPTEITMDYNTLTVGPSCYYLFSNTSPVTAAGASRTADAVFQTSNAGYPDLIWDVDSNPGGADADAIGILQTGYSEPMDVIGWTKGGHTPNKYEGAALVQGVGFQLSEQYVRYSSTSGVANGIGRAYDSGSNNVDFTSIRPLIWPPRNSSDVEIIAAGTPAEGAYVTVSDGLSQLATATLVGSPPYAYFSVPAVATGTWQLFISSRDRVMEISTVTVTVGATIYVPNATTSPVWPSTNYNASILNVQATQGYISGWVKGVLGTAISPAIQVRATTGESTTASTSNGMFFLRTSTGVLNLTANPNNLNSQYVSLTSDTLNIQLGQVMSDVNFTLSQGGKIQGSVTRDGINALPGVAINVLDTNGFSKGNAVSMSNGQFLVANIATGTYSVEPILGSGETASPSSVSSTVTAGGTVNVGTFTISGAFGSIRGNVTSSGSAIRSGVLIVCSTATLLAPPTLNSNSLTGLAVYTTNSYEDGTYDLDVRGSTVSYRVYAYYTTFSVNTPSTTVRSVSGVSVTAGNATTGVNFTW